jgi:uncharacterized phage protein gp47/JayE
MALPVLKNFTETLADFQARLGARVGLTNLGADTATRSLVDVLSRQIIDDRNSTRAAFIANQLTTAKNRDLDNVGNKRKGLTRLQASFAEVDRFESSLAYFVKGGGTFGSINGGMSITLLAGTSITSPPNPAGVTAVEYLVTENTTLPAGETIVFVSARARVAGSSQNVGTNVLETHNFTSYTDAANKTLECTNIYSIINARDRETDDQFRFRLSQHFSSIRTANASKLKLDGLVVPGVLDVRVLPGYLGIGTAGVIVFGAEGFSTTRMVKQVQDNLLRMAAPGLNAVAIPGMVVNLDFDMQILTKETVSEERKAILESGIRRSFRRYFSTQVSETVVNLSNLRDFILRENKDLLAVTTAQGRNSLFNKVFIRRGYGTSLVLSDRETLDANSYSLSEDEYATLGSLTLQYKVSVS